MFGISKQALIVIQMSMGLFLVTSCVQSKLTEDPSLGVHEQGSVRERINNYVEELVNLNEVPGLALAVIHEGKVIYEGYHGVASLDRLEPVTKETVFRLYSTSKLMTAVAVFQLEEQGKLALSDPISIYFDDLPPDWNDVTIGHLLAHASGLPDIHGVSDEMADEGLSDQEFFKLLFLEDRQHPTGDRWSYTQTNYLLLKNIMENVTKTSFESYLRAQAFSGIPANRVIFSSNDFATIPHRAKNYRFDPSTGSHDQKLENWGPRNNVLAGLNLTLDELVDWSQSLDAGQFVSPETRARMWTQYEYKNSDDKFLFGWGVYPVSDQTSYGFTGGGVTGLRKFPNHDLTIIVLTNGHKYYSVHNTVINHVAGLVDPALEYKPAVLARMFQHEFLKAKKLNIDDVYDRIEREWPEVNAEEAMTSLGYKLNDVREPNLALAVFTEISRRNPGSFSAFSNLGYFQVSLGRTKDALASFDRALILKPGDEEIQSMIRGLNERR